MLQNNWSVILETIKVMKAKGKTKKLSNKGNSKCNM